MVTGDDVTKDDLGFWAAFRRFFLRGLAALLPTLLTIAVIIWAYHLVDRYMGRYINSAFIAVLARTVGEPKHVDPVDDALRYGTPVAQLDAQGRQLTWEYLVINHPAHADRQSYERRRALWQVAFAKYKLGLIGFVIAVIIVWFVGFFLASFVGHRTYQAAERLLTRVPVVKAIYPHIKQITDFVLSDRRLEFRSVVAVEYPRAGIWSIGLLTGSGLRSLEGHTGSEMVSVFIPSSPTPFTGYTITVPRRDVLELPVPIDEALRFVVSAGVIKPTGQARASETGALAGADVQSGGDNKGDTPRHESGGE